MNAGAVCTEMFPSTLAILMNETLYLDAPDRCPWDLFLGTLLTGNSSFLPRQVRLPLHSRLRTMETVVSLRSHTAADRGGNWASPPAHLWV